MRGQQNREAAQKNVAESWVIKQPESSVFDKERI